MSYERKKQLNMLDRNLDFTKSLSSKMQEGAQSGANLQQGYQGQPADQSQQGYEPSLGNEGGLPSRGGPMSQSVDNMGSRRRTQAVQPPQARNDYDYIKIKNSSWGNKFDIISNKIKDFAK